MQNLTHGSGVGPEMLHSEQVPGDAHVGPGPHLE